MERFDTFHHFFIPGYDLTRRGFAEEKQMDCLTFFFFFGRERGEKIPGISIRLSGMRKMTSIVLGPPMGAGIPGGKSRAKCVGGKERERAMDE